MPRACSICTHASSAEISKALAAGASDRDSATRFGVTSSAIQRHRVNCLRAPRRAEKSAGPHQGATSADPTRFDTLDPASLVSTTAKLVAEALDLLENAKKADDRRTALAALREARDGLALLMRASGMLAPDASVNIAIDQRRQSVALMAGLSEADLRALVRQSTLADGSDPARVRAETFGTVQETVITEPAIEAVESV